MTPFFMTVEEVKKESMLFTLENVKHFPMPSALREDFYTMWQRFGPQAARDYMIPPLWNEVVSKPSEVLNVRA
jgi:hypothetical protein